MVRVPWPISVLATRMRAPLAGEGKRRLRSKRHFSPACESASVEEQGEPDASGFVPASARLRRLKALRLTAARTV